jgi:hypothetical protein
MFGRNQTCPGAIADAALAVASAVVTGLVPVTPLRDAVAL